MTDDERKEFWQDDLEFECWSKPSRFEAIILKALKELPAAHDCSIEGKAKQIVEALYDSHA